MTDHRWLLRRETLLGGTVGIGTLLAGCTNGGGADDTDESGSVETLQLGPASGTPVWAQADGDRAGVVFVHDSAGDLRVGTTDPDETFDDDRIRSFVDATDFESQRLLRIEGSGPNSCYTRIEVAELTIEEETVHGDAIVETHDAPEACAQVLTYPRVLVRVDETVEAAELTITDGWGEELAVRSDDQPRFDPAELDGIVTPGGDPPAVPEELSCEDRTRKTQWNDDEEIHLGEEEDAPFALRVEEPTYEYGETATIRLTNTTMDWPVTGNRYKYNLQVQTAAGWQDIRVKETEPIEYTDEGVVHQPGEGFTWEIELTETGVLDGHVHEDRLAVCPDLQTGRYRFVYWPTALAVEFDLIVE